MTWTPAQQAAHRVQQLYHFTCGHGARRITRQGFLLPNAHWVSRCGFPLVWATDLPNPDRDSVGLTSYQLKCDRTEARYLIKSSEFFVPWLQSEARKIMRRRDVECLEEFGRPVHWFIASRAVFAVRDRGWTGLLADPPGGLLDA